MIIAGSALSKGGEHRRSRAALPDRFLISCEKKPPGRVARGIWDIASGLHLFFSFLRFRSLYWMRVYFYLFLCFKT